MTFLVLTFECILPVLNLINLVLPLILGMLCQALTVYSFLCNSRSRSPRRERRSMSPCDSRSPRRRSPRDSRSPRRSPRDSHSPRRSPCDSRSPRKSPSPSKGGNRSPTPNGRRSPRDSSSPRKSPSPSKVGNCSPTPNGIRSPVPGEHNGSGYSMSPRRAESRSPADREPRDISPAVNGRS
jgi:splicing factor, arginine/serine-rich 7